jgi:hypothetical protein
MCSRRAAVSLVCVPPSGSWARARGRASGGESTQSVLNFDYSSPHTLNSFVCARLPAPSDNEFSLSHGVVFFIPVIAAGRRGNEMYFIIPPAPLCACCLSNLHYAQPRAEFFSLTATIVQHDIGCRLQIYFFSLVLL